MKKQLIIAGFHRSGTSMLAQELHNAGLFIGKRLMSPNISNADGHFEDMDFLHLHEKILRYNQKDWQYVDSSILNIPLIYKNEMQRIVNVRNNNHNQWGFKDPRSALFLNDWYQQLDNPFTIIIYRHYSKTSRSLLHRASGNLLANPNHRQLRFWYEDDLAYRMWLAYNHQLIDHALKNPETTIIVSQDALINGYSAVKEVKNRFGFDLNTEVESSIKPSLLSNEVKSAPLIDTYLEQELEAVWTQLQQISSAPANENIDIVEKSHKHIDLGGIQSSIELIIGKRDNADTLANTLMILESVDEPVDIKIQAVRKRINTFFYTGQQKILIDTIELLLNEKIYEVKLWQLLGDIYRRDRQEEKALYCDLMQLVTDETVYPRHYNRIANGYLAFSHFDKATFFIHKALSGDPKNPGFYLTASSIELQQCNYDEALKMLNSAIEIAADNSIAKINAFIKKCVIYNMLDDEEMMNTSLNSILEIKASMENVPLSIDMKLESLEKDDESTVNIKQLWSKNLIERLENNDFMTEFNYMLRAIDEPLMRNDIIDRIGERLRSLSEDVLLEKMKSLN